MSGNPRFGISPAAAVLGIIRELEALQLKPIGMEELGLLDMDAAGLEAARLSGVDPDWIRSAEQIKIHRRRSAAARKGWATRRKRKSP